MTENSADGESHEECRWCKIFYALGAICLFAGASIWMCQPGTLVAVPADQIAYRSAKGNFGFMMAISGMLNSPGWHQTANWLLGLGGVLVLVGIIVCVCCSKSAAVK